MKKIAHIGPAVYQLTNPDTEEFYIGASSRIEKRTIEHITELTKNKHKNKLKVYYEHR